MSIWIWMCALCVEYGHVFPLTELLADLSLCRCQTLQKPNVVCHHHLTLHHMAMVVLHSPPFKVGLFDFLQIPSLQKLMIPMISFDNLPYLS